VVVVAHAERLALFEYRLHLAFCILNYPSTVLRVGIDGRAFGSPAAGVRRYVRELVPALQRLDEPLEIVALGGDPARCDGLAHVAEPAHPPTNLGWTLVGLPSAAARARVDLIHAPAYTAPFLSRIPIVITIHDVSYERHPEWYPYRRDWVRRAFYRRSARAAAQVLTDSTFSAAEIVAAYGIPMDRIAVAPLGVCGFGPAEPGMPVDLPAGVTTPFLLHVGDLHERRNLPMLVDALLEARRHFGTSVAVSLVLAGLDRGVGDGLCAMATQAGMPDAVVRLGMVEDERLQTLYRAATALVYPSLYEGFGLPVLEAMASGTPVIASQAASIPEVLGDAGILLSPTDASVWAQAIVRVINDESLRSSMRHAGLARAATFTWRRTAQLTCDAYHRAIAGVQ
jgi:glycosyltransferase involved in cell wall biosynthesis